MALSLRLWVHQFPDQGPRPCASRRTRPRRFYFRSTRWSSRDIHIRERRFAEWYRGLRAGRQCSCRTPPRRCASAFLSQWRRVIVDAGPKDSYTSGAGRLGWPRRRREPRMVYAGSRSAIAERIGCLRPRAAIQQRDRDCPRCRSGIGSFATGPLKNVVSKPIIDISPQSIPYLRCRQP